MIYRFEIKRQLMNALIWAFVILAVFSLLVYGFYPVFLDCRPILEEYIASFPPGIAKAFGFDLDDLFGFESYSGMVYLYVSVLGAIMISSAAISVFAREKKEKCRDFLMTKLVRRGVAFGKKLLCCLTLIGIVSVPYMALYLYRACDSREAHAVTATMWLNAMSLPLTQLLLMSIGIFTAVFLRKVRSAAGLGMGIGMFAFLLSAVFSLTEKEGLKYVSPLYYFSPNAVAKSGGYDPACVALAAVLFLTLLIASFVKYTREDLAA